MPFSRYRLVSIRELAKKRISSYRSHHDTPLVRHKGLQQFQITLAQCAGIPDRLRDEVDTKLRGGGLPRRSVVLGSGLIGDVIALAFILFRHH